MPGDDQAQQLGPDEGDAQFRSFAAHLRGERRDDLGGDEVQEDPAGFLVHSEIAHQSQEGQADVRILDGRQDRAHVHRPGGVGGLTRGLGEPVGDGRQQVPRAEVLGDDGGEQVALRAEVIVHELAVDAGGVRDGLDGRTLEPRVREHAAGRRQDVVPAGAAVLRRSRSAPHAFDHRLSGAFHEVGVRSSIAVVKLISPTSEIRC